MHRSVAAVAALAIVLTAPGSSFAQFDEEGDLIPGLLGRYIANGETVEAIDVTLSHDWGTSAPDERLPDGPLGVEWESQLLLRDETSYTFHAYVAGAVKVEVDGELVLSGERAEPGWISGEPIELSFSLLDLTVEYRRTGPSAQVHLFWSSDEFPLEPIPPHLLFRAEGRPDLAERERGRQLFAAHRCNRCHRREGELLSPPAPSLEHVATGLADGWLVDKLLSRDASAKHARMPSFGFTADEARDVAAYLQSMSKPVDLPPLPPVPNSKSKKEPPDGDLLVKSVGCLACHTAGDVGQHGPFSGGDLTAIGEKRSAEWIFHWLADPQSLNADHRMPLVKLTDIERAQIARELASWRTTDAAAPDSTSSPPEATSTQPSSLDNEAIARGRILVERSRCAACHRMPGEPPGFDTISTLAEPGIDWERSCLAAADRRLGRPEYPRLDEEAVRAVRAYIESRFGPLSRPSMWTRGRHVLEQRNCLGCHERDLGTGIVPIAGRLERSEPRLRGQSQSLIPPSLTAVGDKLHDQALLVAVRGEQKEPRLPWLAVRMPRFHHSEDEQAALVKFLIGHDRIPEGAPAPRETSPIATDDQQERREASDAEQTLLTGHALTGAGGFNCVACHKFGEYEPRNVAMGTKGCDLLMIQNRMRAEFFHRWTRAPLRVVPGMEMPNFNKPVAGVLEGDIDRQLAAVWRAINDPRFTAPTNPTQVEQLLVVQPQDEPQIVRDVFTVNAENGRGAVARPLAVGFGNGHSLLIDLDRPAVRGWTLGDFARQRTEGKSWYWDLAGLDVATGFDSKPELLLRNTETGETAEPVIDGGRATKLIGYASDENSIHIEQLVSFNIGGGTRTIKLTQHLASYSGESAAESGIVRTLTALNLPDGCELILRKPEVKAVLGGAAISADAESLELARTGGELWTGWIVPNSEEGVSIRQTFFCTATRPLTKPSPRPELPPVEGDVLTLPGMVGKRLPLPSSIMPTALAVTDDEGKQIAFTSLKGHVYSAQDTDADGLADDLIELEQGLAAPFGIMPFRGGLLVAHKPELLWLKDVSSSGRATRREVFADGWGYSDDYHDWTTGPVQDPQGNFYLGIGSNYSQKGRSRESSRWRGKVLRIDTGGTVTPFAHELRYPQGIAIDGQGRLFVSDQQGVANTFNEINHIEEGHRYGVKSLYDAETDRPETRASVQVPHPWTRSVNGIFFLPEEMQGPLARFAGHGVGCEYNSKFLIRFTLQDVDGQLQGACYLLSRPEWETESQTFLGPICGTATPSGEIYIGSIFDSGWLGGPNTGEIVRLVPGGDPLPNGIRELRATSDGFEIEFVRPVDVEAATNPGHYVLSGYTRVWQGSYATPDSGRYTPRVTEIDISADGRTVHLSVDELREAYVYEINCAAVSPDGSLFPATGHYTMNRIPASNGSIRD